MRYQYRKALVLGGVFFTGMMLSSVVLADTPSTPALEMSQFYKADTDGDGIIDMYDTEPDKWNISDRDLRFFMELSYRTSAELLAIFDDKDENAINQFNINKKSRIARMQSGDFGIVQTGWGADYQDATSFLGLFSADSVYNFGKWNNPTYDKLLAQAKTQSGTKRLATLKQANDTLLADQAVVPLCQPALATLLKDNVTGVAYNTIGQYNFKEAQVK